jgi:hypothetical protein
MILNYVKLDKGESMNKALLATVIGGALIVILTSLAQLGIIKIDYTKT